MTLSLDSRPFGLLPTGQPIDAWTFNGPGGLLLETITYGGAVTRLLVPDREGRMADVVLGFNDLDSYLASNAFFGANAGRVAGRLTGGAFQLDGKIYDLVRNDPPNHLHGGLQGFDKKVWTATPLKRLDGAPSLRLTYRSRDGEEGYPGNVDVAITYTLGADATFLIETEAVTDHPTPFSTTHHSYFNLAGEGTGSVADHELQIHAAEAISTDKFMTLLGVRKAVTNHGNDFRQPRRLGDAIPSLFKNHGDLYALDSSISLLAPAARLVHPGSGRVLSVSTTEAYLQLYTGASLRGDLPGKSNIPYGPYAGICLECEGYPDGANTPDLGDIILRPGQRLKHTTAYTFSTCLE